LAEAFKAGIQTPDPFPLLGDQSGLGPRPAMAAGAGAGMVRWRRNFTGSKKAYTGENPCRLVGRGRRTCLAARAAVPASILTPHGSWYKENYNEKASSALRSGKQR
jgi:hypothetical protein